MSQSVTQTRFHKKNRFPGPNPQHHLDKTVILLTFLIENVMLPIGTCRQGYSIARLELLRRAKTIVGLNVERTGHEPPGRVILREGKWMDAFLLRLLNLSNIWLFIWSFHQHMYDKGPLEENEEYSKRRAQQDRNHLEGERTET
jgi:hypothetical protein